MRRSDFVQGTTISGRPVLTAAHTIISLAARVSPLALETAVDDALVRRLVRLGELHDRFASWAPRRQPGVGDLREILRLRDDGGAPPTSQLERCLRRLLDDPTLPAFVYEHELPWRDSGQGRVDAYAPECSLIVEADGRAWHTREREFVSDGSATTPRPRMVIRPFDSHGSTSRSTQSRAFRSFTEPLGREQLCVQSLVEHRLGAQSDFRTGRGTERPRLSAGSGARR